MITVAKLMLVEQKSLGQIDLMVRRGELKYIGNGRYQWTNLARRI